MPEAKIAQEQNAPAPYIGIFLTNEFAVGDKPGFRQGEGGLVLRREKSLFSDKWVPVKDLREVPNDLLNYMRNSSGVEPKALTQ